MATTTTQTLTIANAGTTSDACTASDYTAFGLVMPAAFTGATITFTVCTTLAGTYQTLYDILNNALTMTVVQGRSYDLPGELTSWAYFKIVSVGAEAAQRSLIVTKKRP